MRLAQQIGIAEIERYVSDLRASIGSIDLTYPAALRSRGVGAEAAFVQFLLSWANSSESRKLVLLGTLSPEAYAERLADRLTGRVAALLCTSAKRHRNAADLTRVIKSASERSLLGNYYDRAISKQNVAGSSVVVLCADTAGFGEPRSVYSEDLTGSLNVKDPYGFLSVTERALSAIIYDPYRRSLSVDVDFTQAAASLLYELFSNTHDHARSGFGGTPLTASCRGFQIRVVEGEDRALIDAAKGYAPLSTYLKQLPALHRRNRQILEISVFDAGLGFAQQLTRTPLDQLTVTEERAAVDRCFAKGVTTKTQRRYGQGLPQVISLLRERKGFIRLRTGRLSLSRDLKSEASWSREKIPEFDEWTPADGQACSPVQGSCLTVLMPVEAVQ